MEPGFTKLQRLHVLNSCISLESNEQLRAAGALISAVRSETSHFESGFDKFGTTCVQQLRVEEMLILDPAAYAALQIFREQAHPSLMGLGKS